ncbi:MAG: hypothetical protein RIR01_414 [Bacteroidota bacterium]|jgi:rhamnogalacturonan endolyase
MNQTKTLQFITKFTLCLWLICGITAATQAQRTVENLNRGLQVIRLNPNQVYINWRMLGTEPTNVSYNLYCNGNKLTAKPITASTNFLHEISTDGNYYIRAIINNTEEKKSETVSVWQNQFLDIPMQIPSGGTSPDGRIYTYNVNDCSVGDVDGDGQYEIFVKWDPSNAHDNSQKGYTGNVYIDCYRLDGTQLWRIDLGKNIRAGAHYTQFMVYDLDSDGKAELACKTADGTIDGTGTVIGSPTADYRNSNGFILSGPEFLTVFNGLTGKAMASADYLPERGGNGIGWGDDHGNRVDRFIAAIAYLDGKNPSLVMGRGYYTRLVRVAWDWRNNQLTKRWVFDSNTPKNRKAAGQGNHQMTVGDVDGDGKDEVCNGSNTIDDNGTELYSNGLGHGDSLHMTDMDPDRPGQEVWQCHESPSKYGPYGLEFRDAKTGEPLWGVNGEGIDVGRGLAADIDPRYKGYECWGAKGNLYDCKGNQIATSKPSMNFAIWWDGDLSRELLNSNRIDKWDYSNAKSNNLLTATGYRSNNGTKSTPCLSADLFGDWREEVIFRKEDNSSIRIYTTTIPTEHKLYTLMHDPQYRVAIAWQNSAYNQPPHPSFYLGTEMAPQSKPNIVIAKKTK